ncbi:septal ring lytic transglycosylase RlpA family protein [Bartonella sp. CB169]|uniref:septal ring lytic transglycosylase RlpA family protein n=1 Tax=Bartonella sp. CB169 TaxID=3112257 RepID=UPI00300E3B2C
MVLNSKNKFTFIVKSTFQFASVIVISLLLISCSTNKTTNFAITNSDQHTVTDANTPVSPKKILSEKKQSKKKRSGRAVVGKPYHIKGKWYYPQNDPTYKRVGEASWYGSDFHGRLTANGEVYDMNLLTAAHPTMPLPSYARVTNLQNGSSIIVRVNDRGPFMKNRIIDLSKQAAEVLGYANAGVTNVKVEYISKAPIGYYDSAYLIASYTSENYAPSLSGLTNIPKEREDITLERIGADISTKLGKVAIKQKQLNKAFSIRLPKIGPLLIDKPILLDQVAFINKSRK